MFHPLCFFSLLFFSSTIQSGRRAILFLSPLQFTVYPHLVWASHTGKRKTFSDIASITHLIPIPHWDEDYRTSFWIPISVASFCIPFILVSCIRLIIKLRCHLTFRSACFFSFHLLFVFCFWLCLCLFIFYFNYCCVSLSCSFPHTSLPSSCRYI